MSEKATNNLLSTLQVAYRKEMNEIADHLAMGGCTTFDEYKKCVGMLEGLAYAERALLDLNEVIDRD
jgi:3-oxoacyl-[acyl-carrier-protein] synthase III